MTVTEMRQNDRQRYRKFRFPFTNCFVTLLSWIFPFVAVSTARPQKRTDIARKGEEEDSRRGTYRAWLWVERLMSPTCVPSTEQPRKAWMVALHGSYLALVWFFLYRPLFLSLGMEMFTLWYLLYLSVLFLQQGICLRFQSRHWTWTFEGCC